MISIYAMSQAKPIFSHSLTHPYTSCTLCSCFHLHKYPSMYVRMDERTRNEYFFFTFSFHEQHEIKEEKQKDFTWESQSEKGVRKVAFSAATATHSHFLKKQKWISSRSFSFIFSFLKTHTCSSLYNIYVYYGMCIFGRRKKKKSLRM